MAEIPAEIIETYILPKLPIESLPNMKLVCKSFNALISSPEFAYEHLRQSMSTNTGRLIILNINCRGLHTFNFDALESPPFYIPFPETFSTNTCLFGSCNGLVCLGNVVTNRRVHPSILHRHYYRLMLLNPFTGMTFEIPSYNLESGLKYRQYDPIACQHIGFGFDDVSQDYKIVLVLADGEKWEVMLYSLKENSWKMVVSPILSKGSNELKYFDNPALIDNHLLHWVFTEYDVHRPPITSITERNWSYKIGKIGRIGCFDLRTEKWVDDVGLPNDRGENLYCYSNCQTLGVFDGRLCLMTSTRSKNKLTQVEMWVMKEYGVRDSWVKVLGASDSCLTSTLRRCPLGLAHRSILDPRPQHEMLVLRGSKHSPYSWPHRLVLTWYNMKQKKIRLSEVHDDAHVIDQQFYDVSTCTKSLVTLPGGTRIRKERQSLREI